MSTYADLPETVARRNVLPERILVAVDDSPASIRAAKVGIALAATSAGVLRAVTVLQDGVLSSALARASTEPHGNERRHTAAESVLRHVLRLAGVAQIVAEAAELEGQPGPTIVADARAWGAQLVVVGRSERPGVGQPYVGEVTQHVLELTDVPVLVVP